MLVKSFCILTFFWMMELCPPGCETGRITFARTSVPEQKPADVVAAAPASSTGIIIYPSPLQFAN